eukprot:4809050-Lingulodinium_polyedra.AAC.1
MLPPDLVGVARENKGRPGLKEAQQTGRLQRLALLAPAPDQHPRRQQQPRARGGDPGHPGR